MKGYKAVWKCIVCNKWYGDGAWPHIVCPKCGARHLTTDADREIRYISENVQLVTAKRRLFKYIELGEKNEKK